MGDAVKGTGPTPEVRAAVLVRSGSRCELCGKEPSQASLHHRRPRMMGGSRTGWINSPENLLLLCGSGTTGCHALVESNRSLSYSSGWLLRSGLLPWETPFACGERWYLLLGESKLPITLPFQNLGTAQLNIGEVVSDQGFSGEGDK